MSCKNCGTALRTDYNFCPVCGAKVIRNRLDFKSLWLDVKDRYFNWDNTFIKTFVDLFRRPQVVIGSYISGIRRLYLNPISYLGITLAVSGLFLFLMRKVFWDDIFTADMGPAMNMETAEKIMTVTLDFTNFVFLLYIPILAFAGWMVFNKRNYNLAEYIVVGVYTLSQYSLATTPLSILVLIFAPSSYLSYSFVFIAVMALYAIYVLNKLNGRSIGKSLLFLFLFVVGFFGVSILMNLVFLATGLISLEDLAPKP